MIVGIAATASVLVAASEPNVILSDLTMQEAQALWIARTGDRLNGGARATANGFESTFIHNGRVDGAIYGRDCTVMGDAVRCRTIAFQKTRFTVTCTAMELIARAVQADRFIRTDLSPAFGEGDMSKITITRAFSLAGGVTRDHLNAIMDQFAGVSATFVAAGEEYGDQKAIAMSGPPEDPTISRRPGACTDQRIRQSAPGGLSVTTQ